MSDVFKEAEKRRKNRIKSTKNCGHKSFPVEKMETEGNINLIDLSDILTKIIEFKVDIFTEEIKMEYKGRTETTRELFNEWQLLKREIKRLIKVFKP